MAKFECSDIGMDCGFKIEVDSEEELMSHIGNHAKMAHNIDPVPDDTLEAIRKAIK
jgi:predicted small metal-binding protein